jgi:LacI family transcriptional regulator
MGRAQVDTPAALDGGRDRPTMSDVAGMAGVSLKTVSRVVNAEPGVRPETAECVRAAVRELGFRPNVMAADFARGTSRREIGLVIDDISNPFWAKAARAIEDLAAASGRHVITASSDFAADREHEIIDSLVAHRLGGLLIVPVARDHGYLAREMELGTAIVFLDRPQGNLAADNITLDDFGGARAGTAHLIAHGHHRVALLAQSMRIYTMTERRRGYLDALVGAGIDYDPALETHAETVADAREATRSLRSLDDPPTAILCANNRMSVGAISGLGEERTRVALIGFDDLELAEVLAVPLSVVRADPTELGKAGAELLLRRMDGWHGPPTKAVLPTTLVARGSGEITPS